jgi:hypothetical protein
MHPGAASAHALLLSVAALAGSTGSGGVSQASIRYSHAVAETCAGALLFEGSHQIGTRAGAVAVSRDIRRTGTERLRRVDAIPRPAATARSLERWLGLERRLVGLYSTNYLRIWNAIERADTRREQAELPRVLQPLIDEPYPLQRRVTVLELALRLPDCTGGFQPNALGAQPSGAVPPA